MKIGILQCDYVLEQFQPAFGDYPKMIATLFAKVSSACQFDIYQIQNLEYPQNIHECDAYITTGSRYGVNDNYVWIKRLEAFICELNQAKKPLVGICFGHQLIAKALGGVVEKSDKGWGVGVSFNQVVSTRPWMEPHQDHLNLIVSHQDQVIRLPKSRKVDVLVRSSFCPYYMLAYNEHFISVQGHPEFSKEYSASLMNNRRNIISSERIMNGEASLQSNVDDQLITRWIVNFFAARMS